MVTGTSWWSSGLKLCTFTGRETKIPYAHGIHMPWGTSHAHMGWPKEFKKMNPEKTWELLSLFGWKLTEVDWLDQSYIRTVAGKLQSQSLNPVLLISKVNELFLSYHTIFFYICRLHKKHFKNVLETKCVKVALQEIYRLVTTDFT